MSFILNIWRDSSVTVVTRLQLGRRRDHVSILGRWKNVCVHEDVQAFCGTVLRRVGAGANRATAYGVKKKRKYNFTTPPPPPGPHMNLWRVHGQLYLLIHLECLKMRIR